MGVMSKSGRKILVVDDNETIVISITKVLEKEGYRTDSAYDGMTAIKKALYNNYGLILLDISLPDIDGYRVCTELKKNQATRYIPIIFISTHDDDQIYTRGFDLGVMDYLKKPIPSAELVFRIKNYLRLAETENKLRQSELLFRNIVNDQTEFVVRYKPDGTLTFVNSAFSLYMQTNIGDLLGRNFFDLLNIEKGDAIRTRAMSSALPVNTDTIEIPGPGNKKVWHQWTQRSILDRSSHKVVIQSIGRDITEDKVAEINMLRWVHIFTSAGFGILVTSSESIRFEQMNRAYAEMHGYTVDELAGVKISTVFKNGTDDFVLSIINKVKKYGHYSFESIHIKKNGEEFPAFTDMSLMKDESGQNSMLLATIQDISETAAATRALQESEERFRTIFMNSPDTMAIFRLSDYIMVNANDRFFEASGFSRKEIINSMTLIPRFFENPADMEKIIELLKDNDVISNLEINLVTKNKHHYPALFSCSKISLNDQAHVVVTIRNIEVIKRYQESLLASETKFRLLADYNYNWEFWLGPDKNYIYVSPSCEGISGYKPEEFMKSSGLMKSIVHPKYSKKYCDHTRGEKWQNEKEVSLEFPIIDRQGNEKWILHNCNPVYDQDGKFLGRRGSNSDITRRKISENELLKISTAMKQSKSYIIILDTKGMIEYVNPYFEEMTGYSIADVIGKNILAYSPEQGDHKYIKDALGAISKGEIWQGELINRKRNKETSTMNVIITPIKDENNKISSFVAVGQDITKQKEIDRQILQTIISTEEKERSRFARDLHDDLGPLLSTAKLYIRSFETATDQKNRDIAINMTMKAIDEAIISIKEIANNISPHVLRNFGLISGIQSFISKINETNTLSISFKTNLEDRFDENTESSIFRIVAELTNNTIKHANATEAHIAVNLSNDTLMLDYRDNGSGCKLDQAFDKKMSRGLNNILNRTKSLGGEVVLNGGRGKGFSAHIEVPVATRIITR